MSRRMQDSDEFSPGVRSLAAEANLPLPSWHVGVMREEDSMTSAGQGLGDGAPPARDDRTWILYRETPFDGWQVWPSSTAVDLPEHFEVVEVVPRSELARVQGLYEQMCSKEMSAWQKVEVLSERLDQAREARRFAHDLLELIVDELPDATNAKANVRGAMATLAASGVTEKGDGSDG